MARNSKWKDGAVLMLLAHGYAVTKEPDRISEWDLETMCFGPRQRSFHRALKQRKALLAWCYARTAWPAAWDWMDTRWLSTLAPTWPARALAVATAALTKKEREESEATTWKLLPNEIEDALIDWDGLVGRHRRVYTIPTDSLFWITRRGRVPYTTIPITLTSGFEPALEASVYWRGQLPADWARREEAYDDFYITHFPTDIPDEWSLADREKSHGCGILALKEVPAYEKYMRRWFGGIKSRVVWGPIMGITKEPNWDTLYESAQAEWRINDAIWKLTPAKKILKVVKYENPVGE